MSARAVSGAAIGIVCKAPQAGLSKTRLAKAVGAAAASELSACFLRDVAEAIAAVPEALGRRGYGVYAPAGAESIMRQLLPANFGLLLQAGDDLGHVLIGATRALLDAGHDCMLLVNGDSPTLPPRFLTQAIEALRAPGDRMVLGPASDGGYYLIGLKQPHQELFRRSHGEQKPSPAAHASVPQRSALPRRCFRNGTMWTISRHCAGSRRNWPASRLASVQAERPRRAERFSRPGRRQGREADGRAHSHSIRSTGARGRHD